MLALNRNYSFYLKLLWLFFIAMLLIYARGASYNGKLVEEEGLVVESASKAPFLIFTTLLLFILTKRQYQFDFKYIVNNKWWLVFFILIFFLCFTRGNFKNDLVNFGTIFFSYALFFLLIRYLYKIPFKVFENNFILIGLCVSVLCAIVHVLQGFKILFFASRSENNFDRLGGMFYYAHTAVIISITFLMSYVKYLETKHKKFILICVITGILLIATDTRSAWFATFISLGFIHFKKIGYFKLAFLAIAFYFIATSLSSSFAGSGSSVSAADKDTEYRTIIWEYSMLKVANRPLNGYGGADPFEEGSFSLTDKLKDPHNSLISLALQGGVIVLIIYLIIYFRNNIIYLRDYNPKYRFLFFYWLFFPFYWGKIYDNLSSFISMFMFFTIYAIALNPNNKKLTSKLQLYE